MKLFDKTRFTESRLADDEDQLAVTLTRELPTPHEDRDFLIATDQWCEMALARAPSATARSYKLEQRHRLWNAFQFMAAALLGDKKTGDLALNLRCHDDAAGLCNSPARAPQC